MAQTAPTKGNLNAAKRSRALADNGYELMDRKRNILIREIMELMDEAEDLQERIDLSLIHISSSCGRRLRTRAVRPPSLPPSSTRCARGNGRTCSAATPGCVS